MVVNAIFREKGESVVTFSVAFLGTLLENILLTHRNLQKPKYTSTLNIIHTQAESI